MYYQFCKKCRRERNVIPVRHKILNWVFKCQKCGHIHE